MCLPAVVVVVVKKQRSAGKLKKTTLSPRSTTTRARQSQPLLHDHPIPTLQRNQNRGEEEEARKTRETTRHNGQRVQSSPNGLSASRSTPRPRQLLHHHPIPALQRNHDRREERSGRGD